MKILKPVNIQVDALMDADDYGCRLTEAISQLSPSADVVNIVKVHLGDNIKADCVHYLLKDVASNIKKMGAKNCVFIPIKEGFIEDVTVDYIEVVEQ